MPSSLAPIQRRSRDQLGIGSRHLVTGGCGFIGSPLADHLVALGCHVRILDDLSTGRFGNAPAAAELMIGDVADEANVRCALHEVDGCFHLAAAASVVRCNTEPLATNRTNLAGTLNVLIAAAKELAGDMRVSVEHGGPLGGSLRRRGRQSLREGLFDSGACFWEFGCLRQLHTSSISAYLQARRHDGGRLLIFQHRSPLGRARACRAAGAGARLEKDSSR
jgi:NAD(P)-dependent dehydrogenase (short-subunit alcohol dehydrogenase family)